VQAAYFGQAGILGLFPDKCFKFFIEIGLYLTNKEQMVSWHGFSQRHCVLITHLAPRVTCWRHRWHWLILV